MMNAWDALRDWVATMMVAALAWTAGVGAANAPGSASEAAAAPAAMMLGWAQAVDQGEMRQVDEAGTDEEPLDQGAPPAQTDADAEPLDTGTPAGTQDDDIELLDQGTPPAGAQTEAAPAPAAAPAAPAAAETVSVAPAPVQATGFALPEGFGDGQVRVSTGPAGFPRGLESCHVGAVTGRAYVGVDCGDGNDSFVGHAPTFEDFPFVTPEDFPFDPDSPLLTEENFPFEDNTGFFVTADDVASDDVVVVSAGRGTGNAAMETVFAEDSERTGNAGIALAQRARDRDPVDRSDRQKAKQREKRQEISSASAGTKEKQSKGGKKSNAKSKEKGGKERAKSNGERKEQRAKGQHKEHKGKKARGSSGKREHRRAKK